MTAGTTNQFHNDKAPENLPLISVIVPIYNAAAYLERTVRSVMAQDYANLEIILVDDGSKDDSLEICKQLSCVEGTHPVIVVHQENKGLSGARNTGVQAAGGDLVGFVDSDDLIYPDMYSNLYRGYVEAQKFSAGQDKPVMVMIGREEIDEEGNTLPAAVTPPTKATFQSAVDYQKSLLLYTGDVSFCTKLLPRDFCRKHPFEPGVLAEDFSLQMKLVDEIAGIYLLPEIGYRVVHRRGSLTRRANPSQFSRVYIAIVEHADYIEERLVPKYPELAGAARRFGLFERLDYLLHVPIQDMNRGNWFYQKTVKYLRKNFVSMLQNPDLTKKNKIYLTLLSIAPKLTRQIHWALRKKAILADAK